MRSHHYTICFRKSSTRPEEKRNTQGMLINNVKENIIFIKIFFSKT